MNNLIKCMSSCGCLNAGLIDSFKTMEKHNNHLIIRFDENANLGSCIKVCEDNQGQCCSDLNFSIEKTSQSTAIKISGIQNNNLSLSELISRIVCSSKDREKCCDD